MSIKRVTPFRQAFRAYSAILSNRDSLEALQEQHRVIAEQSSAELQDALARSKAEFEETVTRTLESVAALVKPEPGTVDLFDRMGLRLLLDQDSMLDKRLVEAGEWEAEQVAYFGAMIERLRKKNPLVFLDIGSYFGLYSLIAHKSCAFDQIHAFEADRHNFAQLQANLFLNRATKAVTSHNKAVGDKDGTLFMRDSTTHQDGSRAGVGVVDEASGFAGFHVPSVAIDSALHLSGCHVMMKIDVEGFEASVLRGLTQTIADNKVVMQIEVYDENAEPAVAEIDRLGLRQIHGIYPDRYLTNMLPDELGL